MNAWDLGTISGIRLRVHWTFFLLPLYIYFSSILAGSGIAAATISIVFVLAIFGCVVLHELGHAFAARQFGIGTRDITLLPIGGVAALERIPRNPFQELWIAVAGPLVNVVIATVLFVGLSLSPIATGGLLTRLLTQLAWANVILVLFNLIPAFPMDGGRVLRSILAMFMGYGDATHVAATVGQVVAVGFGVTGFLSGNISLLLVAAFVFLAARSEQWQVSQQDQHGNFPDENAAELWHTDERPRVGEVTVPATLSVRSAAAWLNNQHANVCAVIDSGRVLGRVSRSHVMLACAQGLGNVSVVQLLSPPNTYR